MKGSLTAREAAQALARGFSAARDGGIEAVLVPMADGGEGTVDAFVDAGATRIERRVRGPLGKPADAAFALEDRTAVIEMAQASGLTLVPESERDVLRASTYGTGELVKAALDAGAHRIVFGIGGSATNDGGAGMLRALGVRLLDAAGAEIDDGGAALEKLARIDLGGLDARIAKTKIDVAADVDNPLCGPRGASAVYGPQKGASPDDVRRLDAALGHFADVAARALGHDDRDHPSAGAAGGLGFALIAFLGAAVRHGVELVAELRGLREKLDGAALCVTGEGHIDAQTVEGKTIAGVARIAQSAGVPVIAFAGAVDADAEAELARRGVITFPFVDRPMSLADAMRDAAQLCERAGARVARAITVTLPDRPGR
jgi:glycerate 2-kinase